MHSREKGMKLVLKTLVPFTFGQVSQTHVQHWCGLFCFAAGFRRPLFSILQEAPFVQNFPEPLGSRSCIVKAKRVITCHFPRQS